MSARPEGGHEAWFGYTDNTTPATVYRYDARSGEVFRWARAPGAVEVPDVRTRQVTFSSKDGTEVRMLVMGAGAEGADGHPDRPRPLYGYGGFGISMAPACSASILAWVEAAACTRSRRCAAAARRARTGTARACASTSRPWSTTSTRRRRR